MRAISLIPLFALAAACAKNPPCLADNQPAAVENILPAEKTEYFATVRLRLNDGTKRVCVVNDEVAKQLRPGDVIRGPITSENDYRIQ